jgi:streptomycin 6-kinase
MASTDSITITYSLNPPPSSTGSYGDLKPQKTIEHTVAPVDGGNQKEYYAVMRKALANAKFEVGDDLTKWRDAVGKAELQKETQKSLKEDEEEESDEEDA